MSFEKTKAQAEHSEEEVQNEQDLKDVEDTTTGDGQPVENESDSEEKTSKNEDEESETEETIESLKARLAKAESDRDNYKQGIISRKAKSRNLVDEVERPEVDLNEQVVMGVLEKQTEKAALRNTIDPKHSDYIPELVDDFNYQEIITYLPRSMDKGDYNSIIKSLKLATRLWKEEKGIEDKPAKPIEIPSP